MTSLELHPESIAVAAGRPPHGDGTALNPPITLSTSRHHDSVTDRNPYLRHEGSEIVQAFEDAVGALEGGTAVAFSSGMAAVAAVAEGQPAGAVAVVPQTAYSGSITMFEEQQRLGRMTARAVDITDSGAVRAALPGATLLWLESLTNPLLGVADLPALFAAARDEGVLACVDSTFTTPLVLRPLACGADLVMHSATKFLGGHSDLLLGVLVTASPATADALRQRRALTGAMPGALEAYLALRGLRTLAVRMQRAQHNAMIIATRLAEHPAVHRVRYPGLPGDPGHERARAIFTGFGAVVAFELDSAAEAEDVCRSVRLITHATSLGGVETLIERRARYEVDAAHGTPPGLVRLSVGIEHVEDLWADLSRALAR